MDVDVDASMKVVVAGNGTVGKSSLIRRYCQGVFSDDYKKTIGVDFMEKQQYIDSAGEDVTMMVWDTAGQEEFGAVTKSYYRGGLPV
jgi:Ras-related protein Rab-23